MSTDWLKNSVFYEIYPQSFYDSNSDGIGDLQGITIKLDYIKNLGCNAVWINPIYDSPFMDAGYDVRDYKTIAPRYGTMNDFDELEELASTLKTNSLCALGQTASNPVMSTIKHFRDEYIAHIVDKKCPAKVCKNLMQYKIDKEKCAGCGMCAKACPADAISKTDYVAPGRKLPALTIDPAKCVKCGACMATCKFKAIFKD